MEKRMYNNSKKSVAEVLILLAVFAFMFSYGCKKDDGPAKATPEDITNLTTAISEVGQTLQGAKEGFGKGQYQRGALTSFKKYVDSVTTLRKSDFTSDEIKSLISAVKKSHEDFKTKTSKLIAQDNLIGHWTMDASAGETAFDYSGADVTHDGTLTKGHADYFGDDGTVVWAKDRYGDAGRALYFKKGGNVEVPFKTSADEFFPENISFAFWFNLDADDSYTKDGELLNAPFISNGSWAGYNIALRYDGGSMQRQLRMEVSERWTEYDGSSADSKAKTSANITDLAPPGTWHHVAIVRPSDAAQEKVVYVDGKKVKVLVNEGKALVREDYGAKFVYHLIFGQSGATGKEGYFEADGSGGYYNGHLDEMRMYNKALSADEVKEIYDIEKP